MPSKRILFILLLVCAYLLNVIFSQNCEHNLFAYGVYVLAAYTIIIFTIRLCSIIRSQRVLLHKYPFMHKYLTEMAFRAEIALYLSLSVDLLYSIYNALAGIYYHSAWFGATALYYMILSMERFFLVCSVQKKEDNIAQMYKKYCFCGYCLLFSTITILIISFYNVYDKHIIQYSGSMIYAAASYTFYNFSLATTNLVRYQKLKHPIYTASKLITFATALVSMLSLQTAMFAAFGDHSIWQKQMMIVTSIGVCILITSMAVFMIRKSNKLHKNILHDKLK